MKVGRPELGGGASDDPGKQAAGKIAGSGTGKQHRSNRRKGKGPDEAPT
jgi:hypothetical protein